MVERYGMDWYGEVSGDGAIVPRPDGEFVRYSDYEALRARLETVEEETRERCAQAVDEQAAVFVGGPARTVYGQGYQTGCKDAAASIRNLEPRHD